MLSLLLNLLHLGWGGYCLYRKGSERGERVSTVITILQPFYSKWGRWWAGYRVLVKGVVMGKRNQWYDRLVMMDLMKYVRLSILRSRQHSQNCLVFCNYGICCRIMINFYASRVGLGYTSNLCCYGVYNTNERIWIKFYKNSYLNFEFYILNLSSFFSPPPFSPIHSGYFISSFTPPSLCSRKATL